jgi:hypothetical protein
MELIERYLQAVKFWLPKTQKQDIIAELSADIYSQVEEKESELGRSLNNAEVETILKQRGRPVLVANRYQPQEFLIGPVLFPVYTFVLKMITVGYLLPSALIWIAIMTYSPTYRATHGGWPGSIGTAWANLWSMTFFAIGTTTVFFAVLEQAQAKNRFMEKWEPRKLPPVRNPNQIKRSNSMLEIVFLSIFGVGWWLTYFSTRQILNFPGIRITLAPNWSYFFWAFLVINIANITLSAFNLARPYWNMRRAIVKFAVEITSAVVFYLLLRSNFLGEIWVRNLPPEKTTALTSTINAAIAHYSPVVLLIGGAVAARNAYRILRLRKGAKTQLLENSVAVVL